MHLHILYMQIHLYNAFDARSTQTQVELLETGRVYSTRKLNRPGIFDPVQKMSG